MLVHSATSLRHRMSSPAPQGWGMTNNLYCQLCDGRGHVARVCQKRSHNHLQARDNYVARFQIKPTLWVVDSGSTHHIASDTQSSHYARLPQFGGYRHGKWQ